MLSSKDWDDCWALTTAWREFWVVGLCPGFAGCPEAASYHLSASQALWKMLLPGCLARQREKGARNSISFWPVLESHLPAQPCFWPREGLPHLPSAVLWEAEVAVVSAKVYAGQCQEFCRFQSTVQLLGWIQRGEDCAMGIYLRMLFARKENMERREKISFQNDLLAVEVSKWKVRDTWSRAQGGLKLRWDTYPGFDR